MAESKCPVSNCVGFCWKNVWHWVVLLALLPFALRGVSAVVKTVGSVTSIGASAPDKASK